MQISSSRPLWIALVLSLAITALYLQVVAFTGSIPAASDFFGHSLGVIGFTLMILTETLYSIRKRSNRFSFGRLSNWLEFHIVTGIFGPFMVLLHSSWKFNGLAGIVLLLTVIIVLSGFVGRYIYTALPRTADGIVLEADTVRQFIARAQSDLDAVVGQLDETTRPALNRLITRPSAGLFWWVTLLRSPESARPAMRRVHDASLRLATLQRQHRLMAVARRAMSLWHAVHVPIGLALFTTALVHTVAAFYYATLLH
ncbi:MAG: hypothetical protein EPO32_02365 [Anaerolineae bacterium]|nr:MAG: hypothetical protein EPO32_02365 [Anaerolineae bacterium]